MCGHVGVAKIASNNHIHCQDGINFTFVYWKYDIRIGSIPGTYIVSLTMPLSRRRKGLGS